MNTIKVFFISLAWLVFLYIVKDNNLNFLPENIRQFIMNSINWFMGFITIISIFMIMFGLIGFTLNKRKINEDKKKRYEYYLISGIIVFITAMISYSMVIVVTGHPIPV